MLKASTMFEKSEIEFIKLICKTLNGKVVSINENKEAKKKELDAN